MTAVTVAALAADLDAGLRRLKLGTMRRTAAELARHGSVERTINRHIDALPDVIAGEIRQWVKVIRGQGRRAHQELPFSSVRSRLPFPTAAASTPGGRTRRI